jgi:diaminohydroxyphosphoribosylaminopyrimidine deaminase / 5-amino-6-(5-phosphoribosylamino)uracil reductase
MSLSAQLELWLSERRAAFESGAAKRPFVTLSYAQSWDGSISMSAGEALALSGSESCLLTHQLRSFHQGILVGIGTVLADDPQLTVRHCAGASPQPIVLDSHLRMPPTARLCLREDKPCWVLTNADHRGVLGEAVEVIPLGGSGRIDLDSALAALWQRGIKSLMVEGGGEVITAFLQAQLADVLVLTIAPTLVGGYKGVGNLEKTCKSQLPRIADLQSQTLGNDLIVWGNLRYQTAPENVESETLKAENLTLDKSKGETRDQQVDA